MKLTQQILHIAGTNGIGFNYHQLYVLGVAWPPKHGWLVGLEGTEISEEKWKLVLELKGKRRSERREILSQTPLTKEVFMRKVDYKIRVEELERLVAKCYRTFITLEELNGYSTEVPPNIVLQCIVQIAKTMPDLKP